MSDLENQVTFPGASELLPALRSRGVRIALAGERIQVSAPAGVVTPELQAAIRHHRDELVALLAAEEAAANAPIRLTPAQTRLWLLQQIEPGSAAYNLTPAIRIQGALDVSRLERALAAVIERHEPLRSGIDPRDPTGLIRPLPIPEKLLSLIDLTALPPEERRKAAIDRVLNDQRTPFDLTAEIPFRATLLRLGPAEHQLVTTFHHICVDGTSLQHFYRDLATCYDGGSPPALRARYRDFAAWQGEYWDEARRADRIAFWRGMLEGVPPVLELPVDTPRTGAQTFQGGIATHVVSGADHDALRALMREEGASLFMTLLAATGAALHAHTGQRDMVIGTPLHGRDRPEFGDLVGMFINQLPLRVRVPSGATLRRLVRDARATALATMTEHELPFGEIVDAVGAPRDTSRNPLFQVLLNVLPPTKVEAGLSTGQVSFVLPEVQEMLPLFDGQSRFDITLYVTQRPGEIHLHLVYNSDVFSPERGRSFLDSLVTVLTAASRPDEPVHAILASPVRAPYPPVPPPSADTVVHRIRARALSTPDAPAIDDGARRLSYAELVAEFDGIARIVAAASPDRSLPVGVMVPHDHHVATAILGVLASGRPYVPLDPDYPAERLRLMAADSGLAAILSTRELRERAAGLAPDGITVVATDDPIPVGGQSPITPGADDLAYLLYTSGSTGTPKAVRQSHGNMRALAERYRDLIEIGPSDRLTLMASISFDGSLQEIFGGLLGGASVHPVDPRTLDLSLLPEIVSERGLTTLHMTPAVFRALCRATRGKSWSTIRVVVFGGEPVRLDDIVYFDEAFPDNARVVNMWGASEHSEAVGEFIDRSHRSIEVPIGYPLGDVEVVLLDSEGREDPVVGVMALRSAHNALGYHGLPELTARAFLADPVHPGRTLFRTGDLVRRRPDGRLVGFGRADAQVKVRGHRIELSEVESVLRRHPAVEDAGVHAPIGVDGEHWLVACYVTRPGVTVTVEDLASWCAKTLPRYMVPGGWVRLDALPRTPSRKVDRKALPIPNPDGDTAQRRTPPASASEVALAAIWAEVLDRPEPAREHSFFELGGNSLLAVRILATVRERFGVTLPLRAIFDAPRLAEQAALLDDALGPPVTVPDSGMPEEFVDV